MPDNPRTTYYRGETNAAREWAVHVHNPDAALAAHRVMPLEHHVLHSPDGFSWGYHGSGPAELARCLLWDHLGTEPTPACYQAFKVAHVGNWPQDGAWQISAGEVDDWLAAWRDEHPAHFVTVAEQRAEYDADDERDVAEPQPGSVTRVGTTAHAKCHHCEESIHCDDGDSWVHHSGAAECEEV